MKRSTDLTARSKRFWRIQFCIIFATLLLSSAADANSVWIESGPSGWYNRTYANFTYNSNSSGDIYYVTVGSSSSFLADKYFNATGLIEKNYTFSVKAYNGTAWVGPVQRSFWIDLTLPTVNITQSPGAWLNSSTATFGWQGSDSRSGVAGYYYWLDDAPPVYTNNTSVTLVNIGNGSHVFNVQAVDNVGWKSTVASYNLGINTDLPVVSITSGPSGWTNTAAPTFTWTGTAFNSTIIGYYYRWDSVPQNTTAGASITLPPLPDGAHTFYIQAVDANMHVGDLVSRTFSIDTIKPNTTILSGPNGWINFSILTFSWNGSDNMNGSGISGYNYWLNNESKTFTASTNVTLSRTDGSYVFNIEPVDAAGNIGDAVNRSFGIDTGVPDVQIIYGPSGWINQKNATFGWSSSSASGISGYSYWMDSGSKTFTVNTSVTISSIPEGSHTFSVQAYNLLNVSSNIAARSFSVDTMPPSAPLVSEDQSGGSTTPWPAWNSHSSPHFTWPDSIDSGSGVASYWVRETGGPSIRITSGYSPVLGTGQHTFDFWAVDNVGNVGTSTTIYLRIDITPPTAWLTSASSWFNTTSPAFTWNGSDNESGLRGYYYAFDNEMEIFTTGTTIISGGISPGSHILYLKPVDNVGNNGSRISHSFGVDVTPPVVNITSNQNGWLNSGTQTFTWAGNDDFSGIQGYNYWIDNGTRIYTEFSSATVFMEDGTHTFHVQALDNAGNIGSGDSVSFIIDTTPPSAPVVNETHSTGSSTPNPPWSSHDTPDFQWNTSNDTMEHIEYYQASIDSGAWFNVTTPYHPTLGTGSHMFGFRAVDEVGLMSNITRMYVRIDIAPPTISITSGPDGWTNNSAPVFAWLGKDNESGIASYIYSVDNGTETYTGLPNTTLTPLSEGEHTFSIKAVDNVGLSSANVSRTFSVDTIPPSMPIVNETLSNGSLFPNPPWSSHDIPLFDWADSIDNGSGVNHYEARQDNGSWIRLTAKPWQPTLSSGAHRMDFWAVDNVSNVGNFTTIYLRIDTVAPKINNLSGPSGWTNTTSPAFAWNGSDNESGIAGYYYALDNGTEIFTENTSITLTMASGNHTFSLRAIDNVNLSSSSAMLEFWIDTGLPNVTITSGPSGWTKITAPSFAWKGSDNLSGIKGYYFRYDNTSWGYTDLTYTTLPVLGDGNHTFYVRALDNAGNIGNSDSRTFMIDTVPPLLNITEGPSGWTNNSSPTFTWNGSDNSSGIAAYYYSIDSNPETFTVLTNTSFTNLTEGAHIFRVTAADNAGVNSTASRSFSVDISPPTVNITSNPGVRTNNKTPLFTWSGADSLSGLKGYYYSYDNSSEIFTLATNATLPSLPDGNHTFRVRSVDMVWLSSAFDTWTFTLNTVPPPAPVVMESHSNGSSVPNPLWSSHDTPYFTWPDVIDDLGSPIHYEVSINNGSWAAVTSPYHPTMTTGSYVFRFRAVDSFGNPSDAYPVYIRIDTVPPSVSITSSPSGWTNETILSFTWIGTDVGSGIAGYYYNFDGEADTYTTLSTLNIPTMPDGAHTFNIRAVDNVGLESAIASSSFFTDTNAPSVWLEEMPAIWTNSSTPFFAWNSTDGAGSGVVGYRYWIDMASASYTVNNSLELPYLLDGAHTFNIVAVDRVGWESPVLQYTFNIDTVGPGLFIVNESHSNGSSLPNPPWSTHNTPLFTWAAPLDAGSGLDHYEASINNGTWQTVSSPWHPAMASGNYTFRFRAVDNVGNPGLIYAVYVRIDIDNPVVSSISGPSGWISTNNDALNPYKQNITWGAQDNDNGSGIAGYYYNFDGGADTYTTHSNLSIPALPDGAHTFSVRAVDNVGWTSAYSLINFSLDNAKPDMPVVSETHSNGSSSPNPPWSMHESPYLTWPAVSDIGSGISYYQIRVTNGTWINTTSPDHPVMTTGNYTFDIRAVDVATNPGDYYRIYVRIDVDDPTISTPAASLYSTTGSVNYTTNPADVGSGVRNVYMEIDDETGNITFEGWIGASGAYTYTSMSPGMSYKARAYAVDNAGRTSAWSAWGSLTMYDPWPPVVTQPNVTTPYYPSGTGGTVVWVNASQSSITFSFNATDRGSGVDYINILLNTSTVDDLFKGTNNTIAYSGRINAGVNYTYTIDHPVTNTAYIVKVEAFDKAGNPSGWSNKTCVIYDNVFPALAVDNSSKYIRDNYTIITGTSSDEEPLDNNVELTINGTRVPVINGGFLFQINNVTEGMGNVPVIATDLAGNSVKKILNFYRDTQPPIITITSPISYSWTDKKTITISGSVYDNYEMDGLTVNDINATLSGTNWFNPAILNWSVDMEVFEGRNTFTVKAKDAAGNRANATLVVFADYSAPTLEILSPEDGAVIEYPSTTISGVAWDNTGVTGVYVNGNLATGIFGLQAVDWYYNVPLSNGSNTITVTAADAQNNIVSKNITIIRQNGVPSIQITNLMMGDRVGTEKIDVNGTAYDAAGISQIKIEVTHIIPGDAGNLIGSYALYPANTFCSNSSSSGIMDWLLPSKNSICQQAVGNETNKTATGVISWSQNIPLELGMNIIEARVYNIGGLTTSTSLYIVFADVPVITINSPLTRVTKTSAAGILASGAAQTNRTNITNVSLRIYNSDGVTIGDADIIRLSNTSVQWSYPIAMSRFGTFAVELRAYIEDGDYSKKEFIINNIPANLTGEYSYVKTHGRYAMYNVTGNNTIDYYNFVKESPDNGATQNYILHYYPDWGEGWWKIKDNQTLSLGVKDNSGEVAGLPNYSWPVKKMLDYNMTWIAHPRWDYQETPPDEDGENMIGWFKDRPPPNYPPVVSVNMVADPTDSTLPWYSGNHTQHGWVRVNPSVWSWNRYYEPQFPEPLMLDWNLDGHAVPPQVYVGQRAGHDEGDTSPDAPPGVFWMPTTGVHTVGLTATDRGLSGLDDIPGTIAYNPLSGSGSQTVEIYNDPPIVNNINVSSAGNLTNTYSATALRYLQLNGEIPRANPLSESVEPWASQRNPVHIGDPANISLNATDPNIEDMQYADYLHYRYIWGDGYDSNWLNSTPIQDAFITSTELLWNVTTLVPRMNEQASNKTHRYAAWAGTSVFILNQSVGLTAQVRDPYNAITAYNDTIFVYDNAPRKPIITTAVSYKGTRPGFGPYDFVEKRSITFRAITYDPDNPGNDPNGDTVFYMYDWGDGAGSTWTNSGNASHAYYPDHNAWQYHDAQGFGYNIYTVIITAKDTWGLSSSSSLQITIHENRPPVVYIDHVQFNPKTKTGSPMYYSWHNPDDRFGITSPPSYIITRIWDPEGDDFTVKYYWGMNGLVTSSNGYVFGEAYTSGTYDVRVVATDEFDAQNETTSYNNFAPPPLYIFGGNVMWDPNERRSYDCSGFFCRSGTSYMRTTVLYLWVEDPSGVASSVDVYHSRKDGEDGYGQNVYYHSYSIKVTDRYGGEHWGGGGFYSWDADEDAGLSAYLTANLGGAPVTWHG